MPSGKRSPFAAAELLIQEEQAGMSAGKIQSQQLPSAVWQTGCVAKTRFQKSRAEQQEPHDRVAAGGRRVLSGFPEVSFRPGLSSAEGKGRTCSVMFSYLVT